MQPTPTSGAQTIRVLVADDTRIHTQLLADALRRDLQLEVISPPAQSRDLVAAVKLHRVNVVVLSSNLDEEPLRGFELLRELRASNPDILAIMLLDSSKKESVLQAFRAGARGIFSRHDSVETLSKCIRSVYEGQIWANSQQLSFAVEALATSPVVRAVDANGLSLLSKREMDVVSSLAEGLTNREIAERLGLSQHTIKNYLFRVYDKLGVSSRLELLFMTLTQTGGKPSGSWDQSPAKLGSSSEAQTRRTPAPRKPSNRTSERPTARRQRRQTGEASGGAGWGKIQGHFHRNRSAGLKKFSQARVITRRRAKRDEGDFGRAVETHRHPDRSNSNVGIQGERTNASQPAGILSSHDRQDGRTQQRKSYLAAVGVTGKLQVNMVDVIGKVRFVDQQDDRLGLRDAFQSQLEVGLPFQNVIQSGQPEPRAIAFEGNRAVPQH